jgi:IclR family transcriptional regulator, acetate operon repressor
MLDNQSEIIVKSARRARNPALAVRSLKRSGAAYDYNVKSASRALEVIELFGVHRHPLSVTEIATALGIPQSSSSVLLHALSSIGFVTRDRKTRKYVPGIRSVFLGNWIHDAIFPAGSLLGALDALSRDANANVRVGVRSGVHVRYVHVSWPDSAAERLRLTPGMMLPVCHDALRRALLATETDRDVYGIVRRANAEEGARVIVSRRSWKSSGRSGKTDTRNATTGDLGANACWRFPCAPHSGFRRRSESAYRLSDFRSNARIC